MSDRGGSRRPGRRVDARTNRSRIVELAAAGLGPVEIAARSGLAPRTVRGHLADPAIQAELRALQDDRLLQISRRIHDAAVGAADALAGIVRDDGVPALARVAAARTILSEGRHWAESVELVERLSAVEERLGLGGGAR